MKIPKLQCKIMQGISGAGKTEFVKNAGWNCNIVSDDHYFMTSALPEGQYDLKFAREARNQTLIHFMSICNSGFLVVKSYNGGNVNPFWAATPPPIVVVDNINSSIEDILPLYSIADAYGYEVEIISIFIDVDFAAKRSTRCKAIIDNNYLYHYQMWNMKVPDTIKNNVKRTFLRWNEQLNTIEPN
ncbi:hypothetical protein UFOVP1290_198 [uncultured Caudovirales phage]|uniref:AAA domain containing protein n=1 Tax=uncultured Caudovirales phage TaxID=2100421 RepID=A0A6J5RSQ7_9CAUD|nr:hypothetical protein UFOVP1290_198 [uncultured Caudovirales phage]